MNTLPDDVKEAIKYFNKCINALALELHEDVWNDVHYRWIAFQDICFTSPSTASNEDKERGQPFLDMGKCISALHLELPSKVWEDVSSKWMAVMSAVTKMLPHPDNEPKAVQQAAKEYAGSNYMKNHLTNIWVERYNAFLAGASFNKDAVEFAEWCNLSYTQISVGFWYQSMLELGPDRPQYTTQELYNLFLKNKNEIQQAHDKST